MALEIHIAGPGLETRRLVNPGEPELTLGRDIACDINLPDPERNVSRRHLAVWNVDEQLQFRVLSSVNGIDMPFGYAPPGAQGVLPTGQVLRIGDYSLHVQLPAVKEEAEQDPWAVFDTDPTQSSDATLPRPASMTVVPPEDPDAITPEEDPFGDWGFESTFGPPAADAAGPRSGPQPLGASGSDLAPFYRGLGLDKANLGRLSAADLEASGRAIRVALEGLFQLYASRSRTEQRPPGAHGVVPVKDNNPLKTDWPADTKLQYLLGGRAASIGFVSPQRALTDIVNEMLAHDAATAAAIRAAVEATVQEFAPASLKERLLGSGSRLFEGTRAWDAYSRHYDDKSQDLAQWVQQLLDQYFNEAYLRESQRIKGETGSPPD